jgi:hypothetical protein
MGMTERLFPVESEYIRCITALDRTGILTNTGVVGINGIEYPVPAREQVIEIFARNRELVAGKLSQGFNRLEMTPMAIPVPSLIGLMQAAILKHAGEEHIFQTRLSPSGPLVPVQVNPHKTAWIWETLRQKLDIDEIIYFPKEYSGNHRGMTKLEAINNKSICAVPGWSVGLVENLPVMPPPGRGKTMGDRKQLETGFSPREYLQMLQSQAYRGETGKTLEDFITGFLVRLETTGEVSNDVDDKNALWCLGQYLKIPYAELVPTGRWIRDVGRVRLDMHRTGNKLCTKSWGMSTMVRLPGY